ncbi:MAG TPA: penicillin-binding protein 2 [Gaiellaceae bacterium]|nr:penicillin-binding protein 2 [Gaiellaceae bacterium]
MTPRLANRRIRLLLVFFTLAFLGTFGRAVWLQAVQAQPLDRLAEGQHRVTINVPAARGSIVDRNGVDLAIGRQAITVYANPRHVTNPRATAIAAGRALHLDADRLYGKLADRSRGFVYIARKADPKRAAALRAQNLTGLGFYPEERRAYPQGSVAAHVLGFAGIDNHGLTGIELARDHTLAGRDGEQTVVRDPFGRTLDVIRSQAPVEGRDIRLTIDNTLQANAQSVLGKAIRRWGAKGATAVVMNPRNGQVLALAVEPGFDANRASQTDRDTQRNRAVTDTYEPGSTFKVVTVAGALSQGLVTPSSQFTLPPSIQVADRVIHEAHRTDTQRMTVAEILSNSSNVGTVTLAELLGRRGLESWISRFGFGRKTGIDFPGETSGILPSYWSGSTIGTLPIGHGIAITPVQMAAAYAAVANRGVWVRPRLVMGGPMSKGPHRHRIISRHVADQLMSMLRDVVIEGTGIEAEVDGYQVAGKTGTAAKPDPRGGYSTSRYVASFVGVVPASDPRLVILVTVDEPHGAIWGGVVAAPAFQEIAKFALQYLEIPPDALPR